METHLSAIGPIVLVLETRIQTNLADHSITDHKDSRYCWYHREDFVDRVELVQPQNTSILLVNY